MDQERIDGVEDRSIDELAAAWNRGADVIEDPISAGARIRMPQVMTLPAQRA